MSAPRVERHINEKRALDALFRRGPMSRAELARALGLTRSTAGSIVAALVEGGLVREAGDAPNGKAPTTGRPGTVLTLDAGHSTFLGADIGVGRFHLVALDLLGRLIAGREAPVDFAALGPAGTLDALVAAIRDFAGGLGERRLQGLCVTVPGIVGPGGRIVRLPVMGWADLPLLDRIEAAFPDMPALHVENDANAFAVADQARAAAEGRAAERAVTLFLDAGVGGALSRGGRLDRGAHGYAGEIGHMPVGEGGYLAGAALPGSLESFVGREAVLARHRALGGTARDIAGFVRAVEAREPAALAALADWSRHLGRALATLVALFDPEEIVLGGPVSALFAAGGGAVAAAVACHLLPDQPLPRLRRSTLGPEGPALGGASLLHRRLLAVDEDLVFRRG